MIENYEGHTLSTFELIINSSQETYMEKKYQYKVETPIHDNIRELITWECKEHGVKS
jgi:hypothetical protein